jgi:hypothetical protein
MAFGQDFLKGVSQGVDFKSFGKQLVGGFIGNNVLRDYNTQVVHLPPMPTNSNPDTSFSFM